MLRKSLIIGFAALIGAAFIFTGCEKEVVKEVRGPGSILFVDTWVNDGDELTKALMDAKSIVIGLLPDPSATPTEITLKEPLTINEGKAVVFFRGVSGQAITVEGKAHIGAGGSLTAGSSNKISVKGAGAIVVEKGGILKTDSETSIDDGEATPVSALGTGKVTFVDTESKLEFSSATDKASVEKAFSYLGSKGTLAITGTTVTAAPSEIAGIVGVSETKKLIVSGTGAETADTLSILAGLELATADSLKTVKTLTVSGVLNAPAATMDSTEATITVITGGEATLGVIAKLKTSSVAAGGSLTVTTAAFDAGAKLEAASGANVNGINFTVAANITAISTNSAVTIDSLTIPAETIFTIPAGKTLTVNGALTVNGTLAFDATGGLKLPADASLALDATGKLLCGTDVTKVILTVEGATAGTATKAKVATVSGVYTVTTEAATGTGTAETKVIGNASFAFADKEINKLPAIDAAATAAAGTLKAGVGTTLILAGST
jgi:hypothetical protein